MFDFFDVIYNFKLKTFLKIQQITIFATLITLWNSVSSVLVCFLNLNWNDLFSSWILRNAINCFQECSLFVLISPYFMLILSSYLLKYIIFEMQCPPHKYRYFCKRCCVITKPGKYQSWYILKCASLKTIFIDYLF